ncbi:hypothetical protein Gorai_003070 [Gossypium raimondii]|uniref:Uncharacterized protein n=1 Tax=Gossypium raimondii TaxID=29730 RepID=A0A7J8QMW0_GOSRA|nr:hypothetical protein [Gossypium raimondii]
MNIMGMSEQVSGYAKTGRYHEGEMDNDSQKSVKQRRRVEIPLDGP